MARFEVIRKVPLKRNIFSNVMLEAAHIDETSWLSDDTASSSRRRLCKLKE